MGGSIWVTVFRRQYRHRTITKSTLYFLTATTIGFHFFFCASVANFAANVTRFSLAAKPLDEHHEAQEQAGFADRILLAKTDRVDSDDIAALQKQLSTMNPQATQKNVDFGKTDIADLCMPVNFSEHPYADGCLARQAVGNGGNARERDGFY